MDTLGINSIIYADRKIPEMLSELSKTDIRTVELTGAHLQPDASDADVETVKAQFHDAGVDICGYGVVDLTRSEEVEPTFAFVRELGGSYVTVNFPPSESAIAEELVAAAETYDLDVAVHNYSTVHHDDISEIFSSMEDVRELLDAHDHPHLGVCVDTGHFLVMDQSPEELVTEFGDRILAVHLKDTSEEELEDVPGAGRLELEAFLSLLGEYAQLQHPLIIEYEIDPERTTEGLKEAERNVRDALETLEHR